MCHRTTPCGHVQGWLARSGVQYGADLVLYRAHPDLVHSDYAVLVVPLKCESSPNGSPAIGSSGGCDHAGGDDGVGQVRLVGEVMNNWQDLQISQRLLGQVVKRLLLLFVHVLPGADPSLFTMMQHVQVEERLCARWDPAATRE